MKSSKFLKPAVASSKAAENFAVPTGRAPRGLTRQENPKKHATRSASAKPGTAGLGSNKLGVNQEVKAKVFTNLQRSNSTQLWPNMDGALKPLNKTVVENKKPEEKICQELPTSVDIEQEKENSSIISIQEPTTTKNDVVAEKPVTTKEDVAEESVTHFEKHLTKPEAVTTVSEPHATTATNTEAAAIRVYSSERFEVLDIDAVDDKNHLIVKEYILDICDYSFALEKKYPIKVRYLEGRLVNSRMRGVLLDWLVEVKQRFGFMPEILYMAAKTMDRYIQKERRITRKQLQLFVTSMYIAAKFEEVCSSAVLDFSAVSDLAFSPAEVRNTDREILYAPDFDFAAPPAVFFLRRFSKAAGVSSGMVPGLQAPITIHAMTKYIMELTVVDYSTCHLFPSQQAAAALALAILILQKNKTLQQLWTLTLEHYTRVPFDSLKLILSPVASILAKVHEEAPKLKAIYSKYGRNRLSRVSQSPDLHVDEWKNRVLQDFC